MTRIPPVRLACRALLAFACVALLNGSAAAQGLVTDSVLFQPVVGEPSVEPSSGDASPPAPAVWQPAGPPPTPRHTGVKALFKDLGSDYAHLPSKENALWLSLGGGLALAAHPFDDDVNEALVGNSVAEDIFRPGAILGNLATLLSTSTVIYAVGRIKDQPKVSHMGMDLIQSLIVSQSIVQALKVTTRRERPDGSSKYSFPSGHASDTFAFEGVNDPKTMKSAILVDDKASEAQKEALIAFAKEHAGKAGKNVVRVDAAPISMSLDTRSLTGKLQAGKAVKLVTRKAKPGDCICMNEIAYYPPLTQVTNFAAGVATEGEFTGKGLGTNWSVPQSRSAYMGTFTFE